MLQKKVTHKKLRPKPQRDLAYLSWLHNDEQPCCMVCSTRLGINMHHVKKNSTDYRDDSKIIPLCVEHHLGNELSPHGTAAIFRKVYPMDQQLAFAEELYNKYKDSYV